MAAGHGKIHMVRGTICSAVVLLVAIAIEAEMEAYNEFRSRNHSIPAVAEDPSTSYDHNKPLPKPLLNLLTSYAHNKPQPKPLLNSMREEERKEKMWQQEKKPGGLVDVNSMRKEERKEKRWQQEKKPGGLVDVNSMREEERKEKRWQEQKKPGGLEDDSVDITVPVDSCSKCTGSCECNSAPSGESVEPAKSVGETEKAPGKWKRFLRFSEEAYTEFPPVWGLG